MYHNAPPISKYCIVVLANLRCHLIVCICYSLGPVITNGANNGGGNNNWNDNQRMSRKIRYGSRNANNNNTLRNTANINYDNNSGGSSMPTQNGLMAINNSMVNNNNIPALNQFKATLQVSLQPNNVSIDVFVYLLHFLNYNLI